MALGRPAGGHRPARSRSLGRPRGATDRVSCRPRGTPRMSRSPSAPWHPTPAAVVGMSLGGLTTIALTREAPDLVRKVVLVDVTPGVTPAKSKQITDFVNGPPSFASFDELLARTIEYNPTRTESSLRRGILHNAVQREDGTLGVALGPLAGGIGGGVPSEAARQAGAPAATEQPERRAHVRRSCGTRVSEIRVPLLLARGMLSQSVIGDEDEAELLRRLPDAQVVHFDKAGHSIQGDMPVELAQAIERLRVSPDRPTTRRPDLRVRAPQSAVVVSGGGSNPQSGRAGGWRPHQLRTSPHQTWCDQPEPAARSHPHRRRSGDENGNERPDRRPGRAGQLGTHHGYGDRLAAARGVRRPGPHLRPGRFRGRHLGVRAGGHADLRKAAARAVEPARGGRVQPGRTGRARRTPARLDRARRHRLRHRHPGPGVRNVGQSGAPS